MNMRTYFPYPLFLLLLLLFPLLSPQSNLLARDAKGRFVVVIDPGHGGHDSGAKGRKTYEKTVNLNVALQVGKALKSMNPNIVVLYTRTKDVFIGLNERADFANKKKADLFVSIHANSVSKNKLSAKGTETYVLGLARSAENLEVAKKENSVILKEDNYTTKYEGFDPKSSESYIIFEFMQNKHLEASLDVAKLIHKGLVGRGLHDRGVRQAGFLVLRRTSMPSILIELGFMSNPSDENYMASTKGVSEMAQSIGKAIVKYEAKVSNRGSVKTPPPPSPSSKKSEPQESLEEKRPQEEGPLMYRIQIYADRKRLKASDPIFKGHNKKLSYYEEGGYYKYTLYETPDLEEARRLQKKLRKTFKDCFIVSFINGEKQKAFYK